MLNSYNVLYNKLEVVKERIANEKLTPTEEAMLKDEMKELEYDLYVIEKAWLYDEI